MHKAKYAIGAILDTLGRVAICSELYNEYSKSRMRSISVEAYMVDDTPPEDEIKRKLWSQFGIPGPVSEECLSMVAKGFVSPVLNFTSTREIHMFVYALKKPLSLKLGKSPIRFMTLSEAAKASDDNDIIISYSSDHMLKFLEHRSTTSLKKVIAI